MSAARTDRCRNRPVPWTAGRSRPADGRTLSTALRRDPVYRTIVFSFLATHCLPDMTAARRLFDYGASILGVRAGVKHRLAALRERTERTRRGRAWVERQPSETRVDAA